MRKIGKGPFEQASIEYQPPTQGDAKPQALGRNGVLKMHGLKIAKAHFDGVYLAPISSRGEVARAWMEVPASAIPAVATALVEAMSDADRNTFLRELAASYSVSVVAEAGSPDVEIDLFAQAIAQGSGARPRTDAEIVADCNELAREFYALRGYHVEKGYRFDQATHPHEREAWAQACFAYDFIEGTEVDMALAELEEEAASPGGI